MKNILTFSVTLAILVVVFGIFNLFLERMKLLKKLKRLREERNYYKYFYDYQDADINQFQNNYFDKKDLFIGNNSQNTGSINLKDRPDKEGGKLKDITDFLKIVSIQDKYYGLPNTNGNFEVSDEKTEISGIYKFIFNIGYDNKAHFILHSGSNNLKAYLLALDVFITSGCVMENKPSIHTKNFKIKEPGIARLDGSLWVIEKKCKIEFI